MGVVLEPISHIYSVDGRIVPGYSQIIHDLGFQSNGFWTEEGRDKGTALHLWFGFLSRKKESAEPPDERIAGKVEGIKKFLREHRWDMEDGERPLYCSSLDFACSPDAWGTLDGHPTVIEVKGGSKLTQHRLQVAAQFMALADNGFYAVKRYILYLRDGDYRLEPCGDRSDTHYWKACVEAHAAKKIYGGLK